jgi:protein CpxP
MKNRIWLATAAVALAGALTIPAMAQEPQGRGMGRAGAGIGMGPGGRGPGGAFGGGPMGLLRGVQLTDAQREQIRAIHQETGAAGNRGKGLELQRELRQALLADTPDQARIETLKQAIAAHQTEALARRIDVQTRVLQILTPEQRAQLRQRAEQAPGPRQGAGRRGRGGPSRGQTR